MNTDDNFLDFEEESKNLANAWMRHDEEFLSSYLKLSIQDPRFNPQSILTRYAILEHLCEEDISVMKYNELLFSAVMLWVYQNLDVLKDPYERSCLHFALDEDYDATESIKIPQILKEAWKRVIVFRGEKITPFYLERIIQLTDEEDKALEEQSVPIDEVKEQWQIDQDAISVFLNIWRRLLPTLKIRRGDVLEPACGAANDYSALHYMELTKYINYCGFDICEKNVRVARRMFVEANITIGDIYNEKLEKEYDVIFVHDLFEHLSEKGIDFAIEKLCKHCKGVLCLNFFNMEEIPNHIIRPVANYHWNTLSRPKVCEFIESFGFEVQTINILTFFKAVYNLEPEVATDDFYNPRAHTLICRKR